jgi:hypothetical protein
LKRLALLSFSLLLLILLSSCITFQIPASQVTAPVGTPPVIIVFSSNPAKVNSGGKPTLLWSVAGANSVSIDHGIGLVDGMGIREVSPATSTVYTISATNSAGTVTRSAVTTVNSKSLLQPDPTSFSVIGITANSEPSTTGCPNLYAYITADGPCTATYKWESTNGTGYSYTWNTTFTSAGMQKITIPAGMGALPSGPYQVHVLSPNDLVSNTIYYSACGL